MPSVTGRFGQGGKGSLLKGSTVIAQGKKQVSGVILDVRESPANFGSPLIIDFDTEVMGATSWACNLTEARRLSHLIHDDWSLWIGWGLVLGVVSANNPQTKRQVDSLAVIAVVEPEVVKKKRKSKPTIKRGGGGGFVASDEEVPF
jgi:hypothetical protein